MTGVPAAGEKVVLPGGEAAGAVDMFGEIIAGMAAALGTETVEGEGAVPQEGDATAQPSGSIPAVSVAQLLALTIRQQGKAKIQADAGEAPEETKPCCDVPLLAGEETAEPITVAQPLQQQIPVAIEPTRLAVPVQAQLGQAQPGRAQAQVAPAQSAIGQKVAELVKQITGEAEPEKAASRTVAAAQIADLLKAATKPIVLPHGGKFASERAAAGEEASQPAAPDMRSFVHAALSGSAPVNLNPLDPARPMDSSIEAAVAEPQLDAGEFAIERQLDVSAEGEWLDSLAKDIARAAGEGSTLRFKLNPENLGTLRVEITPQANGSMVRLTADTDAARAIIADAQPRLIAEARAAGVRISETHVDLSGQNASADPRRQNAAQEEAPIRTARFLRDGEESDGKPTRSQSERYA
jgi:flagellar hook-length control protein FliK